MWTEFRRCTKISATWVWMENLPYGLTLLYIWSIVKYPQLFGVDILYFSPQKNNGCLIRHKDATFAFIPAHLDYMLLGMHKTRVNVLKRSTSDNRITYLVIWICFLELFKNAFKASCEHARSISMDAPVPPVEVTICKGETDITIRHVVSSCHTEECVCVRSGYMWISEFVSTDKLLLIFLRISDQGGGIGEEHIDHVFDYAYTTAPVWIVIVSGCVISWVKCAVF